MFIWGCVYAVGVGLLNADVCIRGGAYSSTVIKLAMQSWPGKTAS